MQSTIPRGVTPARRVPRDLCGAILRRGEIMTRAARVLVKGDAQRDLRILIPLGRMTGQEAGALAST